MSLAVLLLSVPIAYVSMGAGHGDYFWVRILFPFGFIFPRVLNLLFEAPDQVIVICALAQFPLYGVLLGAANLRGKIVPVFLAIALVHGVAAAVVFLLPQTYT